MAKGFASSQVTLAAATAQNLAALLAAEGYTGSMAGARLWIHANALTDVFRGHDNTVSATNGIDIDANDPFILEYPPVVDPSRIWLFSTGGGDISVSFEPL